LKIGLVVVFLYWGFEDMLIILAIHTGTVFVENAVYVLASIVLQMINHT